MPALPWKSFAAPESDREYHATLSYLPPSKWRAMPKFIRYSRQIQHQLANSEGLLGYSLDANVLNAPNKTVGRSASISMRTRDRVRPGGCRPAAHSAPSTVGSGSARRASAPPPTGAAPAARSSPPPA
jgi:hypothetical protein